MNVARRTVGPGAAAALVWLLVGSAYAQTPAPPASIRIDNFGQVDATYYRGAQPEARDYPALVTLGIKTVIDLTEDGRVDEQGLVERAGMK